jgi:hypothetical protein
MSKCIMHATRSILIVKPAVLILLNYFEFSNWIVDGLCYSKGLVPTVSWLGNAHTQSEQTISRPIRKMK